MCGGAPKVDTTIQDQMLADSREARAKEEARALRIKDGSTKIDGVFGGFDDSFYDGHRKTYTDFYQPEIDKQFGNAKDQLTYALARSGTLNSTVAGEKTADLNDAYTIQTASTLSQANDAAAALRGNVNNEKSSLVSLLNATGDADRAANEATARSQQIFQKQPSYNPLGELFSGVTAGIGNYAAGQANRNAYNTYFRPAGASGSGRVIG